MPELYLSRRGPTVMRPLFQPPIEDVPVDGILNRVRAAIYTGLFGMFAKLL